MNETTTVILGPCPCQKCGSPLVWDGLFWLYAGTNIIHVRATCPASFDHRARRRGKGKRK